MPAPANDNIANATQITQAAGTITGIDNTSATTDSGSGIGHSVWYYFTLSGPPSGTWSLDLSAAPDFVKVGFLYSVAGALNTANLGFVDGNIGTGTLHRGSSVGNSLSAGTYVFVIGEFAGGTSTNSALTWSGLDTITGGGTAYTADVSIPLASALATTAVRGAVGAVTIGIAEAMTVTSGRDWTGEVGILVTAGIALDQRVTPKTGSWYSLLSIREDARAEVAYEAAAYPVACPNDGEPLIVGPDGQKFCPYDGWRP